MKYSWYLLSLSVIVQMTCTLPMNAKTIPPFSALEPPYDQAEWEKTLPLTEQKWIQQTENGIELTEAHQKKHFLSYKCILVLDRNGRFSGTPGFADQEPSEKEQIIKRIHRFHFPALPEGMDTACIFLRVGPDSKVAIRFLKRQTD